MAKPGGRCPVRAAHLTSLSVLPAVKEAAVQRKHNLYRDSMVMHNSDPNLHLLGEGIPIDWGEEYSGQPEAELAADKRRRAKQVVSVIQDDEGALPYELSAKGLLQPSSPEPQEQEELDPGPPPSSPVGVEEIREALAKESLGDGVEVEEQLTNGTDATQESGATEEVVVVAGSVPGDVPQQGPASEGDGVHQGAPVSPAPGAEVPSGAAGVQHASPASPMPASPVPRADVPSGASVQHTTPASPKSRADIPVPLEASVPHATPASPAPRAEPPSPSAAVACHQPSDKETGEEVAPLGSQCSPPQPAGTTESGEGLQTEF